ncbi:HipA domain protein, partial [mine drainage metagenome]
RWTCHHQMTLNGKQDRFTVEDFRACAATAGLKRGRAEAILDDIRAVVQRWPRYAQEATVPPAQRDQIRSALQLEIPVREAKQEARPPQRPLPPRR